jgi:hypothetical protein
MEIMEKNYDIAKKNHTWTRVIQKSISLYLEASYKIFGNKNLQTLKEVLVHN